MLDWKLDIQQAIDLPNFGARYGPIELERGLQGIERVPGGWRGGADPRREGIAQGR